MREQGQESELSVEFEVKPTSICVVLFSFAVELVVVVSSPHQASRYGV